MRYLTTFLCLALASGQPLFGQNNICNPILGSSEKILTIDARSGSVSGSTPTEPPPRRLKQSDLVRVVIVNKNPFLFEYQFDVEEEALYSESVAGFLQFLGVPEVPEAADEPESARFTGLPPDPGLTARCSSAVSFLESLDTQMGLVLQRTSMVRAELTKLVKELERVDAEYLRNRAILTNPSSDCRVIVSSAEEIGGIQCNQCAVAPIEAEIDELRIEAAVIRRSTRHFFDLHKDCADLFTDAFALADATEIVLTDLEALGETLEEAAGALGTFESNQQEVKQTVEASNALTETHWVGDFDEGTKATLKLERKTVADDDADFEEVVSYALRFDSGPRFVLAGGLAFADLAEPQFARVQAVDSSDMIINQIGLESDNGSRIKPLVILHSRLFSIKDYTRVYFSVGATADGGGDGINVEYLIGPSFSFLGDRFFLTVGGYRGVVQSLEGGLMLGQEVPEMLAELPFRDRARWNLGFAVTYRIN